MFLQRYSTSTKFQYSKIKDVSVLSHVIQTLNRKWRVKWENSIIISEFRMEDIEEETIGGEKNKDKVASQVNAVLTCKFINNKIYNDNVKIK